MTTTARKKGYPYRGQVKFAVRLAGDRVSWFDHYWRAQQSAVRNESEVELVDADGLVYHVQPAKIARQPDGTWKVASGFIEHSTSCDPWPCIKDDCWCECHSVPASRDSEPAS